MAQKIFVLILFALSGCNGLRRLEGTNEKNPTPTVQNETFQETNTTINVTADNFVYGYSKVCLQDVDHVKIMADGVPLPAENSKFNPSVKGIWFYRVSQYRTIVITFYYSSPSISGHS